MSRTFVELLALARKGLEGGFSTKQSQKDAAYFVSCAFDMVRDDLRTIGHKERGERPWYQMPDAWRATQDAMPYTPAHWNAKRAKLFTDYPEIVERANKCAELRVAIMACPVVKPTTRPRSAKQMAKDAKARTCQICGRPIFAEIGVIAHHGYERPGDGYQTASCPGARELPFEASKLVLVSHIASMREHLAEMRAVRKGTAAEQVGVFVSYRTPEIGENGRQVHWSGRPQYLQKAFTITRATTDAIKAAHVHYFSYSAGHLYGVEAGGEFDALLQRDLKERDAKIVATRIYIDRQQKRADGWKQLERWNNKTTKWELI